MMDYTPKSVKRKCLWCNKVFYPALKEVKRGNGKFCSLSCVCHYRNKHYMKPRPITLKTYKCEFCGQKFTKRPYRANKGRFCSSSCFYSSIRGIQPGYLKQNVRRKIKRLAFSTYGEACEICSYSLAVDVHHLLPRSKGGKNEANNLAVLCPNHHREVHIGLLRPKDIIKLRVLQVEAEGNDPSSKESSIKRLQV